MTNLRQSRRRLSYATGVVAILLTLVCAMAMAAQPAYAKTYGEFSVKTVDGGVALVMHKDYSRDAQSYSIPATIDGSKVVEVRLPEYGSGVTGLNLSEAIWLKTLVCPNCDMKKLDVSSLANLEELDCSGNRLSTLNLSKNTKLRTLDCRDNRLSSLGLSKNPKLTGLDCAGRQQACEAQPLQKPEA